MLRGKPGKDLDRSGRLRFAVASAAGATADRHFRSIVEALENRRLLTTVFVSAHAPGPTHDGSSWSNAFISLQQALTAASVGETIDVGKGTYYPTSGTDRTVSFQLQSGVALYGGYAGYGASNPNARNPTVYPTILSGDIGTLGLTTDNSYHVVTATNTDSTAILDGFTVTSGNANGGGGFDYGGGISLVDASPTLNNLTIVQNTAAMDGGGIDIFSSSSPVITGSTFLNNVTTGGDGGAIDLSASSSVTLSGSRFQQNSTSDSASAGGAIAFFAGTTGTLTACSFLRNTSANEGGALYTIDSSPEINGCKFTGNSAVVAGGGAYLDTGSKPEIVNSIFVGNLVTNGTGGALYDNAASPTVINTTITANTASVAGGAVIDNDGSSAAFDNDIVWANTNSYADSEIFNIGGSTSSFYYSDIIGGGPSTGNIYANPLFVIAPSPGADGVWGTADDNYGDLRLAFSSPAANTGSNLLVPNSISTDIAGNPRIQGSSVEMGANEQGTTIYVSAAATTGANAGVDWTNAFTSLQSAMGVATSGETIDVAQGTYLPSTTTNRNATFQLIDGVGIYGGYAGYGASNPNNRNASSYLTILSGDIGTIGVTADNSYHVVTAGGTNATAVLDGFTITGGNANSSGNYNYGGGISDSGGSPTLNNLTITLNSSGKGGGGIDIYNSAAPTITNCTISDNLSSYGAGAYISGSATPSFSNCSFLTNSTTGADAYGGAVYDTSSMATFLNCLFLRNVAAGTAEAGGGAIEIDYSSSIITDCIFDGNSATTTTLSPQYATSGGGVDIAGAGGSPVITNSTFVGNVIVASYYAQGGAIAVFTSTPTINNCTIVDNSATGTEVGIAFGGGSFSYSDATVVINNAILWNDSALYGSDIYQDGGGTTVVSNTDIGSGTGYTDAGGNISSDPLFVLNPSPGADGIWGTSDDNYGNLQLTPASQAIGAGSNAYVTTATDLAGNPRIDGGTVDMGAYEFQNPTIYWTGDGDGNSWEDPNNWSADSVPDAVDYVVIDAPGTTVNVNSQPSILSLIDNANLDISGDLTVTTGTSTVSGSLTLEDGAYLYATGAGTDFTTTGSTVLNSAWLSASNGAIISLSDVESNTDGSFSPSWGATGGGSELLITGLSIISGFNSNSLYVYADDGGEVSLPSLTTISDSNVYMQSDGTGSTLSMSVLAAVTQSSGDDLANNVELSATNGGQVIDPVLASAVDLSLIITGDGSQMNVSQLASLTYGSITADQNETFSALTDIDGSSLHISNGGILSLPKVASYTYDADAFPTWQAADQASELVLGGLTSITGITTNYLKITADSGSEVYLPVLASIGNSAVVADVDGAGSSISVPVLSEVADSTGTSRGVNSYFAATDGGDFIDPALTSASGLYLTIVDSGSQMNTSQLDQLSYGNVSVDQSVDFNNLTDMDGTNLSASGGATISLPSVIGYTDIGISGADWEATGSGSEIELPSLTNITQICQEELLGVQALDGGEINIPALSSITDSYVDFTSDGTGSVMNLSALTTFDDSLGGIGELTASDGGKIQGAHTLAASSVALTLDSTSTIAIQHLVLDANSSLDGTGVFDGSVNNSAGTINPGGAGTTGILTIDGKYTQGLNGTLQIDIGGTSPGTDYDQLIVTGNAILLGTLDLNFTGGYIPTNSTTFTALTAAAISGEFTALTGNVIGPNSIVDPIYTSTAVTLTLAIPDLTVTNLSVDPSSLESGQAVTINWNDANIGSGTAGGSWVDTVSVINTTTGQTILSTTVSSPVNPIDAGASAPQSIDLTLPQGSEGIGHLQISVTVDSSDSITETNYSNNTSTINVTSTAAPAPDLQVTGLSVSPNLKSGQTMTIDWYDSNTGNAAANGYWSDLISVVNTTTNVTLLQIAPAYSGNDIAGGTGVARSYSFSLPDGANGAGTLSVTVTANNTGTLFEYNSAGTEYTNNTSATTAVSTLAQYPDLVVADVELSPQSPESGQSVTLDWNDADIGEGAAVGSWYDSVTVFNETTGQTIYATTPYYGGNSVGVDGSIARSATFTLPDGTPGVGQLLVSVTVNSSNSIFEYNAAGTADTNNTTTATATSTLAAYPDLVVSGVGLSIGSPVSGENVAVDWNDANTGNKVASGGWYDHVVVINTTTGETIFDDSPYFSTNSINPNSSVARSDGFELPNGIPGVGQLSISVTVDSTHTIFEYNSTGTAYTNNTTTATATSTLAPYPDLIVTALGLSNSSPESGQPVSVDWDDTDSSSNPAIGSWYDQVTVLNTTTGQTLFSDTPYFGGNNIAAEGSVARSVSFTLPNGAAGVGQLEISVTVNSTGSVYEYNAQGTAQTNNTTTTTVESTLAPYPDLSVTVATPVAAVSGRSISVSFTVTNGGTAAASGGWVDSVYVTPAAGGAVTYLGQLPNPINLAPGFNYTSTSNFTLPSNISGEYEIKVITNSSGSLFELNTTNNTGFSGQFAVSLAPYADLIVTGVTVPTVPIIAGQLLNVSWSVENQGTGGTTVSAWYDYVYISQSPNGLDSTAIKVGQVQNPSYLGAGESYQSSLSIPIATSLTGTYYVYVDTNATDSQPENTYSNNTTRSSLAVQIQPISNPALFQVSSIIVTPATGAYAGQSVYVTWTVTNSGGQTITGTWTDALAISPSTRFDDTGAIQLQTIPITNQSPLLPGGSYTRSAFVTLPSNLSGSFYIVLDPDHYETASQTNGIGAGDVPKSTGSTSISIIPTPAPKLDVSQVNAPTTAQAGDTLSVSWTVTNDGFSSTNAGSWTDAVYLSTTSTLTSSATLIGLSSHVGGLTAAGFYNAAGQFAIPYNLSGQYYVFVVSDLYSQVPDDDASSTHTGTQAAPINVAAYVNQMGGGGTGTTTPPAELETSGVNVPAAVPSGTQANVSWVVTNAGPNVTSASQWYDAVYLSTTNGITSGNVISLGEVLHSGSLGVNGFYTGSTTFTVPNGISGTYYVVVVSDPQGEVFEGTANQSAKTASTSFTVSARPLPSLSVSGVTAPVAVVSSQTAAVTWTVTNSGTGGTLPSEISWTDGVYLSSATSLNSSATLLATVTRNGGLAAAASYQGSATVTIPQGLSGTMYIIVVTDVSQQVYEGTTRPAGESSTTVSVQSAPYAVLSVGSITGPSTVYAGQPITVDWSVTNAPTASTTGIATWYDSVFLSTDQYLNSSTAIALGTIQHSGALAAGGSYSASLTASVPSYLSGPYYIFVETDVQKSVYQAGNTSGNIAEANGPLTVQLAPLAQLSTTIETIPATGITGEAASPAITWTVTNTSRTAANGSWVDAVYMSPDTTFDSNAILIDKVTHNGGLGSGDSYTASTSAALPADIVPGQYHIIVRCDSAGVIPETDRSSNQAISVGTLSLDVQALTLDTPVSGTLSPGQSIYYRVTTAAGDSLNLTTTFTQSYGGQFYVSYGKPPTTSNYDQVYNSPSDLSQLLNVPNATAGTYYILLTRSSSATGSVGYSLTADIPSFGISSISLTHGSNLGQVTFTVTGAQLSPSASVQLVDSQGNTSPALKVIWYNESTLWVTFDLTQNAPGVYSVQAVDGSQTSTLNNVFTVDQSAAGNLAVSASAPGVIRAGTDGQVTFYYSNTGNTDIPAPLLLLSATGAQLELMDGSLVSSDQILGINTTGPAGTLPPGFSGSVTYSFVPTSYTSGNRSYSFSVSALGDVNTAVDWASLKASSQTPQIPNDAWNAIWQNLLASAGTTLGDFQGLLDETATYLSQLGQYTSTISTLLGFKLNQADDGLLPTALDSETDISIPGAGLSLDFSRSAYSTISGRNAVGMLGVGWLTPWDIKLIATSTGMTVDLTTADIAFTSNGSGEFVGPDGGGTLTEVGNNYVYTDASDTSYGFNSNGQISYVRDKNGNQITASFSNSLITTLTRSDGAYLAFTYTPSGYVSMATGSDGESASYTYDSTGEHLVSVTTSQGTTKYAYASSADPALNNVLTSIARPDSSHEYLTYDSVGRLSETDGDLPSQAVFYSYDGDGGVTITNASGDSTVYMLTDFLKPGRIIDPLGNVTSIKYGSTGNPTEEILPGGLVYHFQYDSAGEIVGMSDPLGDTTTFSYLSGTSFLSGYSNALGDQTSYSFDAAGNLAGITAPGGSTQSFTYDAQGQVHTYTDAANQTVTDTYNAAGLLVEQSVGGVVDTYTYDSHGDITSMTDSTGVTSYTYNSAHELTGVSYPGNHWLSIEYDTGGRRTQISDDTGLVLNYSYNAAGELVEISDGSNNMIASYSYDSSGRVVEQINQNGTHTTYQYDAAGNVTQLMNYAANGTVSSEFIYTYDALNRVSTETTLSGTWGYTYDSDSQLVQAVFTSPKSSAPSQDIIYQYDAAGNRISTTDNGKVVGYTTNSDGEYTQLGTYDANGNLINDGTNIYSYNALGELISVYDQSTSVTTTYTYNGLGQRVGESINGQAVQYILDPITGNPISEISSTGTVTAQDIYGMGLVSRTTGGGSYFYSYDANGSTAGLTNAAGAVTNQYTYDPYGQMLSGSSSSQNPYQFLGEFGASTGAGGLVQYGSDLLNVALGRTQERAGSLSSGDVNPYSIFDNAWSSRGAEQGSVADDIVSSISTRVQTEAFGIAGPLFSFKNGAASSLFGSTSSASVSSLVLPPDGGAGAISSISNSSLASAAVGTLGGTSNTANVAPPATGLTNPVLTNRNTSGMVAITGQFSGTRGTTQGSQSTSLDPNSISGPLGYGASKFIGTTSPQVFQIDFENQPTATAPAQIVTISTQLASGWNWQTLQLASISFDHITVNIPQGLSFYSTILDLRSYGIDLLVAISAGINPQTGLVTWKLSSIDPSTGEAPTNPNIGLLPIDDANGDGEGSVVYSIRASTAAATGTVVSSQATVVFDSQPPLNTGTVTNTLDTVAPVTTLSLQAPTGSSLELPVMWSATDDAGGSGVAGYNVFVSTDGGKTYSAWLENTQLTSADYLVTPGRSYAFYVTAFDNAGNVSAVPSTPQATISIAGLGTAFTGLTAPLSMTYGTGTITLSGFVSDGQVYPSTGENVAVTLNGVTVEAAIGGQGAFSAVFNTSTLPASSTAYAVTYSYTGDSNLSAITDTSSTTLTVNRKALTITVNSATKMYGSADPVFSVVYQGLAGTETASVLGGALVYASTEPLTGYAQAGGNYSITASGLTSRNYNITYVSGSLTITQATLSITGVSETFQLGQTFPTLSVTYGGFAAGESSANLTQLPVVTTTANSTSGVGSYPITVSGAVDGNYSITYVAGTLTITQAAPTLTLASAPPSISYTGTTSVTSWVSATLSGVISGPAPTGAPMIYFYAGSSAAGTPLSSSPVNSGTYTVVAVYAGDSDYTSAQSSPITFTINRASVTVSLPPAPTTITYDGTTDVTSWVVATITGVAGAPAPSGPATYFYYSGTTATGTPLASSPTAVGTYTVVAVYSGNSNYLAGQSLPVTFTISQPTAALSAFFKVDDGTAQRSMITSLTVTFSSAVVLQAGALTLTDSHGNAIPFTLSTTDNTTFTLTFTGSQFIGGSLANGRYTLGVVASLVNVGSGPQLSGNQTLNFWRLFGDFYGTGTVNSADKAVFTQVERGFAPAYVPYFDYDGNGIIDSIDINAFDQDFGTSI